MQPATGAAFANFLDGTRILSHLEYQSDFAATPSIGFVAVCVDMQKLQVGTNELGGNPSSVLVVGLSVPSFRYMLSRHAGSYYS
jgi:hypothetical protein